MKEEEKKISKKTSAKKDVKPVTEKKSAKPKKEVKKEKVNKQVVKEEKKKEVVKEEKVKKEVVKKNVESKKESEVLLDDKSQGRLYSLSKVISIVAKIGKVLLMIAVPFIFIAMILIPIALHNLEINGNVIRFSDASIIINDNYVTFKVGDKAYISNDDFKELSSVANFLSSNTKGDIILLTEVSLFFAASTLIISIYILSYVDKLFKNLYSKKIPFTSENTNYIYRIACLMIISIIVSLVFDILMALMFPKLDIVNVSKYGIIEILVIFVIYYIFKYATALQEKSNYQIYK